MTTAKILLPWKRAPRTGASLVRDVSLPALVLHREALEHNIRWMQDFVSNSGAELAPHGKTSMTPALFRRQLDAGAWGITLASATQTRAAYAHGVRRVLMANQLVGTPNMALIADLLADPDVRLLLHGRSPGQRRRPRRLFRLARCAPERDDRVRRGRRPLRLPQRAGSARLAKAIAAQPALALTGIEGYEGVIHGDHAISGIREFAASWCAWRCNCRTAARSIAKPIITASGSAWYDLIAESFEAQNAADASSACCVRAAMSPMTMASTRRRNAACSTVAAICTKVCARRWKSGRTCSRCRSRASR
jgi:D-serine deaminase-like pyridoxal phosphate-dependent protein